MGHKMKKARTVMKNGPNFVAKKRAAVLQMGNYQAVTPGKKKKAPELQ